MFPELDAEAWLTGRPEAALHDLSSAALRDDADDEPSERPAALAGVSEPAAGVSVETILATEYGVHPEQVVLTAGGNAAAFVAFAAALEASEESGVLSETPGDKSLAATPAALGADVSRFERPAPSYGLDNLQDSIDESTAVVAISNRHDPSGRLVAAEGLRDAAARARDADARLLVAEDCAPLSDDGDALGGVTAAGMENTIITGSRERLPGLASLEVGWVVTDPALADAARRVQRHLGSVAGPSRAYALRALYGGDALTERAAAICRENSAQLAAGVAARDDVTCRVFEDAPVAALDVAGYSGDEVAGAAWEDGVLVVPGRHYGAPETVRVGLGRSPERVRAGLDALDEVLDGLND